MILAAFLVELGDEHSVGSVQADRKVEKSFVWVIHQWC